MSSPGAQLKDMTVRLIPSAVVTGDVVDEYNDPIQNVSVEVFSVQVRMGQIALTSAGSGLTDDRGDTASRTASGQVLCCGELQANTFDITIIDGRSNRRFNLVRGAVDRAVTNECKTPQKPHRNRALLTRHCFIRIPAIFYKPSNSPESWR